MVDTKNGDREAADSRVSMEGRRQIPGAQFHYDEKTQLKVRDKIISKLGAY
jgi:hypothetical protein